MDRNTVVLIPTYNERNNIQTLYELSKKKFSIHEIPIFFNERSGGKSKMNTNIVLEVFINLPFLRLRDIFTKT